MDMTMKSNSQEADFSKVVKRLKKIWNGPFQDPELDEVFPEAPEKTDEMDFSRVEYPKQQGGAYEAQPKEPGRDPSAYRNAPGYPENDFDDGGGEDADNVTVISRGTTIVGDIRSDSRIEMLGTMTGNIVTAGNVRILGKQAGDVQGASIDLSACTVRGSLSAENDITVDSDSVIVGDIKCGNLTIDGKLKGNVHVMGNVNCQGNSVLLGDVVSATITISTGAKLKGKVEVSDGSIEQIDIKDVKDVPAEPPKPTA